MGPTSGPATLGPPDRNNTISDVSKIFKLIQICNGSKYIFPCSQKSK
jgi:hypothetical protein